MEDARKSTSDAFIIVTPEMTTVMAPGPAPVPSRPAAVVARLSDGSWSLEVEPTPDVGALIAEADETCIVFLVRTEALIRVGGVLLIASGPGRFHLTSELRTILMALRAPPGAAEARIPWRMAKSIEFMCEVIRQFEGGELAPMVGDGQLSAADTRRMLAARQMIDERAGEKLTLDSIARSCGLNRSKLTRGFRELFNCTVAQAIAERRLDLARRKLLTTDLPVSTIGYQSGYLNNASFARAFGRRFGRSPSDFRITELAA